MVILTVILSSITILGCFYLNLYTWFDLGRSSHKIDKVLQKLEEMDKDE